MKKYRQEREIMLREHLASRGITDEKTLRAMFKTPRENFVDETFSDFVYADKSLPIGYGQTISMPYIVALMTMNLDIQKGNKILEIGTGCGYQTAVLSQFDCKIVTVERVSPLFNLARQNLENIGIENVTHIFGDGTIGAKEFAPFDRIIVTAGAPSLVKPLLTQLKNDGILIIPEGNKDRQILKKYTRKDSKIMVKKISHCQFVPLIGENGWES